MTATIIRASILGLTVTLGSTAWAGDAKLPSIFTQAIPILRPDAANIDKVTDGEWTLLDKASRKWSICASLPTMKDPYWKAVDYGLVTQAERLGVNLTILDAGGYGNLSKQISDLEDCASSGADAVLVAAISGEGVKSKVDQLVSEGMPVIESVNRIASPNVTARSTVDFKRLGIALGEHLKEKAAGQPLRVAWFPGPEGAGWAVRTDEGFKEALKDSKVKVISTKWGDTGRDVQLGLIEDTLQAESSIDWIAGVAPAAEAAVGAVKDANRTGIKIASFYQTDAVANAVNAKEIAYSGNDNVVWMAAMALDLAVRQLQGENIKGTEIWPKPQAFTSDAPVDLDNSSGFAPKDFLPKFQVK
ncbi:TMAO reductase system periplasmic protein TorT [Mesorhizobium sp. WSM4976]|uniref:TMAO reductase system periplasmic protein TorT n=1 Tax=Mesorhizobium sp. WSM4976 TaxID=3038549 RepID=UPI0024174F9C|nr:TMAO reductase system periplasmic protein TorT [Mesorhizobium sp. WSM4976]MDG4898391.1 TMAO reductase system periplasmic protein TorT [Mesorhizobium sp. WSM4976]